jgi:NAD(P)-dependent dehydrogenase (short-subunit alcohol dehydrogenase family)
MDTHVSVKSNGPLNKENVALTTKLRFKKQNNFVPINIDTMKTILITGTSSGIGKETAKLFASKGWNVIATMRKPEQETELNQLENVLVTKLDVQKPATISTSIREGIDKFGKIDAIINNAGYGQLGVFEAVTPEKVMQQFDVNVFGIMNTIREILPHFRENKEGLIINISSGAGRFSLPLNSLYCASKFAIEGFSEALSFELSALNIGVKIIEPGGTTTNFIKTGQENFPGTQIADYAQFQNATFKMFGSMQGAKLATPEEVAQVIFEAASDETDQLRYIVGNDDFKGRMTARLTTPDDVYLNTIKNGYKAFM